MPKYQKQPFVITNAFPPLRVPADSKAEVAGAFITPHHLDALAHLTAIASSS